MQKQIAILVCRELSDSLAPFTDGDIFVSLHDISSAEDTVVKSADFVFLELNQDLQGSIELCRSLRSDVRTTNSKIIMALPDANIKHITQFLELGVDDFMSAPLTRSRVLIRTLSGIKEEFSTFKQRSICTGPLRVDLAAMRVLCHEIPVHLAPTEYRLLSHFIQHPGQIFSRQQLGAMLGRQADRMNERNIDTWIGRTRRALQKAGVNLNLRTVKSLGYILDEPLTI